MKGLLKKVRGDKKGFTLAELLVVVAIIGILVAISIPIFTAQLTKARKATNQANMRAAKAAAVAEYLTTGKDSGTVIYEYNLADGTVTVITAKQDGYDQKAIDAAEGDKKYDGIEVAVTAAVEGADNNTGNVVIYVKKES